VRTRVLRIEEDDKKVGLSLRGVTQPTEEEIAELQASRGGGGHHQEHHEPQEAEPEEHHDESAGEAVEE
jgi:hypothetical protein